MVEAVFRHLPVEMIDVPADRARLLNPVKAEAIGATMKAERQFDPITVSPTDDGRFELVDGQHRLHGAKHVGLTTIEARVIALSPEARRKQEILSNLATAELDALGRARSINALCEVLKKEDGRRRRVGRPTKPDIRGWCSEISPIVQTNFGLSEDGAANLLGWSEEAAAQAGIKRATLFEYLRVARRILPEAAEELANTPIADNLQSLLKISDMGDAEQVEVAQTIRTGGFEKLGDAIQHLRGTPAPAKPSEEDLQLQRAATLFKRMPKPLKLRFLRDVLAADKDVPEAVRVAIGGAA